MPFRHPDRGANLRTRIESEVRERIEEAVDYVCLDALVQRRQARGLPAPVADSRADRAEFERTVRDFLDLLASDLTRDLGAEQRGKAAPPPGGDETVRLVGLQVGLARVLPDYWQRFEAVSARFLGTASASGGERPGLLARLFGRG